MNNRKHNSTNPYQGDALRVLCVCSAGLLRSPTAANVLHREYGYNTRAAGLDKSFALIAVDDVLLHWAQEIVCMDDEQAREIMTLGYEGRVFSLGIEDSYEYMDEELQLKIKSRYEEVALK